MKFFYFVEWWNFVVFEYYDVGVDVYYIIGVYFKFFFVGKNVLFVFEVFNFFYF